MRGARQKLLSLCCLVWGFLSHSYWWDQYDLNKTAVVKTAVADVLINVSSFYTSAMPQLLYQSLPLSCEPVGFPCVRVHQMLFNELLHDATCMHAECCGKIPQAFYGYNALRRQFVNTYCLLSSALIFLSDLAERDLLKYIPAPQQKGNDVQKIITLKLPWQDNSTGIMFSVGTRFVRAPKHDREKFFAVGYINFSTTQHVSAFVPKELCLIPEFHNAQQMRSAMIALIHSWIDHAAPRIIPYVLGGSSYLYGVEDTKPYLKKQSILGQRAAIYQRDEVPNMPCWGFDCSELVWRAARIVGIDYPWKTSDMVERFLKPLKKRQSLEQGDLIWIPGHVMIISDLENNKLIEAVGYKSGFGKVHEIALKDRIKNCSTYPHLVRLFHAGKSVQFVGENGMPCTNEPCPFKILKLLS